MAPTTMPRSWERYLKADVPDINRGNDIPLVSIIRLILTSYLSRCLTSPKNIPHSALRISSPGGLTIRNSIKIGP